ncbi:TPA: phage tail protein I [Acinetobacter baumannii]|nr:phage tail protein I [Acinetobacter baumannii]
MKNLLPPNSTELENNLVEVLGENTELPVDIKSLVTLEKVPSQFLPHIAWEKSVDRWQQNWDDEFKIKQIKTAFDLHRYKGTNYALRKLFESFGFSLTIYEWWQESPKNEPGTFQITIDTLDQELDEQTLNTLLQLFDDARPLTRHCKNIQLILSPIPAKYHVLAGCYSGEETTIFPEVKDAEVTATSIWAFYEHQFTEIYPFGATP